MQEEQHENEPITVIRGQVDLEHQLLAAQEGHILQNDVKVAELAARVGLMGGLGDRSRGFRIAIGSQGTAGCHHTAVDPGRNATTWPCDSGSEPRRGHLGPSRHCASFHHR